ncbi:MAG TPA: peptidoglycan editing factor PgeF [Candidatus Acidoferrales bacterium]|jgi:YfiH family protein|nr:peptidoglycan editing factor PgeF [Candidatus Acidoferrales bacterium]
MKSGGQEKQVARRRARDPAWTTFRRAELQILRVSALNRLPWLVHGFSTRLGGVSHPGGQRGRELNLGPAAWDTRENVLANRARLLEALGAETMGLVTLEQIHSDIVHVLDALPQQQPRGDAAITRAPGVLLGVQTADCVPVLLVDTERRAVAAVHAGWRGTLQRLVAKTLGRMQMALGIGPQNVVAAIGPAIGVCCYEVGPEVAQAYAAQFAQAEQWFEGPFQKLASGEEPNPLKWLSMAPPGHGPPPPRVRLDLRAANRWQLLDAGVPAPNIIVSELCTACRTDLLFSYRKEKASAGRLMGVIGVRV